MRKFRDLYCERHGVDTARFERSMLWRCLHRRAWPVYWLLELNPKYKALDLEFIRAVGELTTRRAFRNEVAEYHYHPHNRGFFRRVLRLRVSSRRLQTLFEREITSTHTKAPFPVSTSAD